VNTPAEHSQISVPLGSNVWTQAAGELDLGPFGTVTFTAPASGSCGGTGNADLGVTIYIDGVQFSSTTDVPAVPDGATRTAGFQATSYLFEHDTAVTHTATVKVSSLCEAGDFPADFTVSDLRFDLVRAS
jgi:hypothetical protein